MWEDFLLYVAIGFAAQLVDGAVGMAYGLTATSVLLGLGVGPATASACIHASEVFTTGASGLSHWRMGNVRGDFVWRLALPGMAGGALGAYVLASLPGEAFRPFLYAYLLLMGVVILVRAVRGTTSHKEAPRHIRLLGLFGGFIDAIGGGGWGPIVTSTLIGHGHTPRYVIGSVNAAEFFVTTTVTGTFLLTIGLELWPIIAGLVAGGMIAAPAAAWATQKLPDKPIMILVGSVIVLLSLRGLVQAVG